VRATQTGDANYNPAPAVDQTFTVGKANQAITFAALADTAYGAAPFAVGATASSGLPVSFSIANGPATISGNTVTLTGAGTVILRASQPGDANTNAAPNVDRTFAVAKATLTATASSATRLYGAANPVFAITYTGFVNGDTAAVVDTAPVATSAATAASDAGTYPITASGGVDDSYAFTYVSGTLTVTPVAQTITFAALPARTFGAAPFAVTATASSGLPVTFSVTSGPATVAGGTVTLTGAGTVTLRASQSGGVNYTAATFVDQSFAVAKAAATITLTNLSQLYTGAPKSATATTSPAGLTVQLTYNGSATAPTAVGTYALAATIVDANYAGTASGTFAITKPAATVTLGNLSQTYDGTPKSATATTVPAGLAVTFTYNGSATAPSAPGSYTVIGTVNHPNYSGSATGTLVISTAVLVRHAPSLNGGLDGSLQVLLPESTTLNGSAWVSGDLLLPGAPNVQLNGQPHYLGTLDGVGAASPTNYTVTLNGGAALRHVVRRTDAVAMLVISAPPAPTGTRDVSLNSASDSPGAFATLRNLTLNGNVGTRTIPAGTYGNFTVNGNSGLILGVAGATTPAVYNLQGLTLNGNGTIQVVGPVVLNLANGPAVNGAMGDSNHPEWLAINVASGGFTINGNVTVSGSVFAPNGTVTLNGSLKGGVIADRLTINGNAVLDTIP
jgi:rhamnogalacturonan endolyase